MRTLLVGTLVAGLLLMLGPDGSAGSCGPERVKQTIRGFAQAYNSADFQRLDRLFVKGDAFRSYQVQPIERPDGRDRSTLIEYFKERHSFNDAVTFTRIRAGRYDNGNRGFGFSLEVTRSSDDISPFSAGHFAVKGSATCNGIYFWNMTWQGP